MVPKTIHFALDLSVLNLDGTQSLAKKGGEKVAYQPIFRYPYFGV
jgi:hypothetical protein